MIQTQLGIGFQRGFPRHSVKEFYLYMATEE